MAVRGNRLTKLINEQTRAGRQDPVLWAKLKDLNLRWQALSARLALNATASERAAELAEVRVVSAMIDALTREMAGWSP